MSKTTKKKYVMDEVVNDYEAPSEDQQIVKVICGRGNNLHEVLAPDGSTYLASMPPKFRRSIWIKRGDFVVVEPIAEGLKVKAEIVKILLKDQIKYYKSLGIWPKEFDTCEQTKKEVDGCEGDDEKGEEEEEEDDDELFVNQNRPDVTYSPSESESEQDEET